MRIIIIFDIFFEIMDVFLKSLPHERYGVALLLPWPRCEAEEQQDVTGPDAEGEAGGAREHGGMQSVRGVDGGAPKSVAAQRNSEGGRDAVQKHRRRAAT
jgi:hypothetical protein